MINIRLQTTYKLLFLVCALGCANFFAAQAQNVAVVNAANFVKDGGTGTTANSGIVTPEGIASAFGTFTMTAGQTLYIATPGQALPKQLGGVKVTIAGTDADLMFVAANQINFVIPTNVPVGGIQTVTVTNANNTTTTGTFRCESFSPGIFSGAGTGAGVAAANWIPPGTQNYLNTHKLSGASWIHDDITVGAAATPTYLILYTTGVRRAPNTNTANDFPGLVNVAESCKVTVQGIPARIDYAGKHGTFVGLDQLNVVIPPELSGLGIVTVRLEIKDTATSTTRTSNAVEIKLAGNLAPITFRKELNLTGDTANGTLAAGDDVEIDTTTRQLYYTDFYKITTTAPNTAIAIDLRSTDLADELDTTIIVRKANTDGTQNFFAADDQGGGFGNGRIEVNNNSLLFTVLPDASEYWILVTSADVAPLDTGSYTLTVYSNGTTADSNVVTPITYGSTSSRTFTTTSKVKTSAGVYAEAFSFTGTERDLMRAAMNSTAFDSLLILRERNGDEIALDDNAGGGLNALIDSSKFTTPNVGLPVRTTLPVTRTFILVATPLETNRTGAYTLGLTKTTALTEALPDSLNYEYRTPSRVGMSESQTRRRDVSSRTMYRRPLEKTADQ